MPVATQSGLVRGNPAMKACNFSCLPFWFVLNCSPTSGVRDYHFLFYH
jgi:hypothetical protein